MQRFVKEFASAIQKAAARAHPGWNAFFLFFFLFGEYYS